MHPAFHADHGFTQMRLGRLPSKDDPRTLRLARYLDLSKMPPIPADCDLTVPVTRWPMYGNDRLGDCTCAAAGHMIQAWTGARGHGTHGGSVKTPSLAAVEKAYWATGDGTDDGRVETDVLNWWRQHGIGGHRITVYAAVDAHNVDHVRAATYLFGGVYTGVSLPVSAQRQQVWDVTDGPGSEPGSWGGHAIPYEAYNQQTFTCITWGAKLELTVAFHERYCDEVYAIISPNWVNGGPSPVGLDLEALEADLAAITR